MVSAQAEFFDSETILCLSEPGFPTLVVMRRTYGVGDVAFKTLFCFEDSPGQPRWHWMQGELTASTHMNMCISGA